MIAIILLLLADVELAAERLPSKEHITWALELSERYHDWAAKQEVKDFELIKTTRYRYRVWQWALTVKHKGGWLHSFTSRLYCMKFLYKELGPTLELPFPIPWEGEP